MNPIGWIEIPVADMGRAIRFYNAMFGWDLQETPFGQLTMAWLPFDESAPGCSGSLVLHEKYTPSTDGSLVYFSSADVSIEAAKVEPAGGKLLMPKTLIAPDIGYMALAIDTEGNRIAFHSRG